MVWSGVFFSLGLVVFFAFRYWDGAGEEKRYSAGNALVYVAKLQVGHALGAPIDEIEIPGVWSSEKRDNFCAFNEVTEATICNLSPHEFTYSIEAKFDGWRSFYRGDDAGNLLLLGVIPPPQHSPLLKYERIAVASTGEGHVRLYAYKTPQRCVVVLGDGEAFYNYTSCDHAGIGEFLGRALLSSGGNFTWGGDADGALRHLQIVGGGLVDLTQEETGQGVEVLETAISDLTNFRSLQRPASSE